MSNKLFGAVLLLLAASPVGAASTGNNGRNEPKYNERNEWCPRVKDNDHPYRTPVQPCFNSDGSPGKANNGTADEVIEELIYGYTS